MATATPATVANADTLRAPAPPVWVAPVADAEVDELLPVRVAEPEELDPVFVVAAAVLEPDEDPVAVLAAADPETLASALKRSDDW